MNSQAPHPWQAYLENVLGVRSVLVQRDLAEEALAMPVSAPVLIVASGAQSAADYELLEKILSATKLDSTKILIVDTLEQAKNRQINENQTLFVFGEKSDATGAPKNVFVFPALVDIRAQENLKRPVWEKIKIALQNII
jgi:DNA polymerase III psi subunit